MVFLDTNIWIELCALRTPVKEHEIKQTLAASKFFKELLSSNTDIVTNKNQLLELIFVIEKTKLKAYNKQLKDNGCKQLNSIKEYRKTQDFKDSIALVKAAVDDVMHWAKDVGYIDFGISDLIDNSMHFDIADALYYKYCAENGVKFCTFDKEIKEFDDNVSGHVVVLVS